jgi:hypothetical protein
MFIFSETSRPALGPTQPPVQWLLGTLLQVLNRPECNAEHSLSLAPRLRMNGAKSPFPLYTIITCVETTCVFFGT